MCLFLWCLIVNYQSGLDPRWDICSWSSSPGRGQMSAGEETKGLNLKEQHEERKRRWEGGRRKKTQRLSGFGSVICSLQTKCFKLAEGLQLHQRLPPVVQVFLALLHPDRDAPGAPWKSCSASFSSQTPGLCSALCLPLSLPGEESLPNYSCRGGLERLRWSWHKSKYSHG